MRRGSVPIRYDQVLIPLLVAGLAAVYAMGLGWVLNELEGKWLIASVVGVTVLCVAVASGRLERFFFGLLLFSIPFNIDVQLPLKVGPEHFLRLEAMDLVLGVLYGAWIVRSLTERRAVTGRWSPGATPLVCLIGWSALSFVNAVDPSVTLLGLGGLAKALLAYLYVANHVTTRDDLLLVIRCLVAGLLLESLIACAQHVTGSTLGLEAFGASRELVLLELGSTEVSRVVGTLGHPNNLGRYLAAVLPLMLTLNLPGLQWRWPMRLAVLAASLLGSVALVLTFSRGAWLSLAVACILLVVWLLTQRRIRFRVVPLGLTALTVAAVLVWVGPLIMARWLEYDQGAAASRIPLMRVAWSAITSHPIFGVGLGNYRFVMHLYDTTPEGIAFHYQKGVHNGYLLLAAQVGCAALMWLAWFLWVVARRGWQRLKAAPDPLTALVVSGISAGLVARLLHGMVEPTNPAADTLLLILSAIVVSTTLQERSPRT